MLSMSQHMSSPVLLLDLSFDSFSYLVAPIVSSAGDKTHNICTHDGNVASTCHRDFLPLGFKDFLQEYICSLIDVEET